MSYVQALAPGFRYGLGAMQGAGEPGQIVTIAGDNVFAVASDPTARPFGILERKVKDGEMPGLFCLGGIYETDAFVGTPSPGDGLASDAETGLLKTASEGDFVLAEVISVGTGVLRFKLLV